MPRFRRWPLLLLLLAGCPEPTAGPRSDAAAHAADSAGLDAAALDAAPHDGGDSADAGVRDGARLDAPRADQVATDLAQAADAAQPEASAVDSGAADRAAADVVVTDLASVDSSASDASVRDALASDSAAPDAAAPDATPPDTAASPDLAMPDVPPSDTAAPDSASPDAAPLDAGPFVVRGAAASYRVTTTVTVHNSNANLTRLSVVLPAPQSNDYQDVSNLDVGAASLRSIPETDDRYALFSATGGLPAPGASASFAISYDVTLYALDSDLGRVTAAAPYDTQSTLYGWYTGPSGVYVVPDNATIQSLSSTLWAAHPDLLGYARAAYEHVAANYDYLDPYSGLHPLAELLAAGGGDCGNLSSIYVSLLRARGIPARHLVTMRPDGSAHVWADFYVQDHGWVPVDVTYKQSNPGGDSFGHVPLASNGIIQDKEVALSIDTGAGTVQLPMLQSYAWWYWSSTPSPGVTSSYSLSAAPR